MAKDKKSYKGRFSKVYGKMAHIQISKIKLFHIHRKVKVKDLHHSKEVSIQNPIRKDYIHNGIPKEKEGLIKDIYKVFNIIDLLDFLHVFTVVKRIIPVIDAGRRIKHRKWRALSMTLLMTLHGGLMDGILTKINFKIPVIEMIGTMIMEIKIILIQLGQVNGIQLGQVIGALGMTSGIVLKKNNCINPLSHCQYINPYMIINNL